ncbi:MAG: UbiX family flavin prenyltransferase [Deltaproteobacteria bacterium]|jgi:4-hydroxy-3-polyprenylbenzoate decarboxylase|nr:UbiX family flavin prenyltransferase [Deltaproteobacteria bacterium]MCL5880309.1 UbiX family flavin prenyltransferase [Deltaproteobacteria bacterium]MDA8303957.1 UbiX family flavin prenyltransferase [Deltaproteobacteria bacterium]
MKENLESETERPSYVVAITGASGAIFGFSLLKALVDHSYFVYLIISKPGFKVIKDELGMFANLDTDGNLISLTGKIKDEIMSKFELHDDGFAFLDDMFLEAKIASGSAKQVKGMAVIPCSMGSLSRIACGNSGNLIERASDVMLKERKKLIVCPRETPFNDIHLKNMLSLNNSGAVILPPIPAFYNKPQSVGDMISFITGKILDSLGIDNDMYVRWKGYD